LELERNKIFLIFLEKKELVHFLDSFIVPLFKKEYVPFETRSFQTLTGGTLIVKLRPH